MNPRRAACGILMRVTDYGAFSNEELKNCLSQYKFSPHDRAFITRLVRQTLENLIPIDKKINAISKIRTEKMEPQIRACLRIAVCQLSLMGSSPDFAVVNEAVSMVAHSKYRGLKGFVNGVLRSVALDRVLSDTPEWVRYSMPKALFNMLKEQYGNEKAVIIAESFGGARGTTARVLSSRTNTENILRMLDDDGIGHEAALAGGRVIDGTFSLSDVCDITAGRAFKKGLIQVMGSGSSLCVMAASPKKGWRVLDMCAAPGGKSLCMADFMCDSGHITACDINKKRLEKLEDNIRRCAFSCISPMVWDATRFNPKWEGAMDLVLADLPCSGLGEIGQRPEIRYRINETFLAGAASLQRVMLKNAIRYVKKGGLLLFSTCTLNKNENEDNFLWLIAHGRGSLCPVTLEGVIPAGIVDRAESLNNGYAQLIPVNGFREGFFISLCRRI